MAKIIDGKKISVQIKEELKEKVGWKPSTSFFGEIAWITAFSSICFGNGSCTKIPCTIIDGKKISVQIKEELKEKVAKLKRDGKEITLAVIQVGNDEASSTQSWMPVFFFKKIILFSLHNCLNLFFA